MFRGILTALLAGTLLSPVPASGQSTISVTRKERNLYKVDGRPFWVRTRYCYQYAYSEEAVLNGSEIVFTDSADKCDIRNILKEIGVSPGAYRVNVTHEDDELYSTSEGTFILTSLCFELGIAEEAILKANSFGTGSLVFIDSGRKCSVEGLLSTVRR